MAEQYWRFSQSTPTPEVECTRITWAWLLCFIPYDTSGRLWNVGLTPRKFWILPIGRNLQWRQVCYFWVSFLLAIQFRCSFHIRHDVECQVWIGARESTAPDLLITSNSIWEGSSEWCANHHNHELPNLWGYTVRDHRMKQNMSYYRQSDSKAGGLLNSISTWK